MGDEWIGFEHQKAEKSDVGLVEAVSESKLVGYGKCVQVQWNYKAAAESDCHH